MLSNCSEWKKRLEMLPGDETQNIHFLSVAAFLLMARVKGPQNVGSCSPEGSRLPQPEMSGREKFEYFELGPRSPSAFERPEFTQAALLLGIVIAPSVSPFVFRDQVTPILQITGLTDDGGEKIVRGA